MAWRSQSLAFLLLCLAIPVLRAQDPPPRQQTPPAAADSAQSNSELPITTLHVYMDLIQVPVLVLDTEQERMKPLDPSKFRVSLDSGPEFRPRHVRQQGDDPITLGILLDTTGSQSVLMSKIDAAIASLAPLSLRPKDHVTIYALDCGLVRSLTDRPADAADLQEGVDAALRPWNTRRQDKSRCDHHMYLWDAIGTVVKQIGELPGRRALLVVTDGTDHGSATPWNDLKEYAQFKGVAVFGLAPPSQRISVPMSGRMSQVSTVPMEDLFTALCQFSGGKVIHGDLDHLQRQLVDFVAMLRERYIVEFTRARNDTPGKHIIEVTLTNTNAFIRSAGVVVTLQDPAVANDPNTIPRDDSDAPQFGKRKILTPHPQ